MKLIFTQLFTGLDGQTFDPARLIGYGSAVIGIGTFVFNSVWAVLHGAAWDAQAYGIGLGAVLAGVMAVGAGVGLKAKTEPT